MALKTDAKLAVMAEYKLHDLDTGSPEVQIALMSKRILELTDHLKIHRKDYSSRRGLLMIIGKRRRLLNYLIKIDVTRYRAIIKALGIRK